MDLALLINSSLAIQLHVACAILALLIDTTMLLGTKGTSLHKALGRLWIALMLGVSLSSFLIHEIRIIGPYSPIHILSLVSLLGLWGGWKSIRSGDVRGHKIAMISVYGFGLIGAGIFTLIPGRIVHQTLLADGGSRALVSAWRRRLLALTTSDAADR